MSANFAWHEAPLWALGVERREVVDPGDLGDRVVHYSIPSVDTCGTGQEESAESIRSAKLTLRGGEVLISKLNPRKSRVLIARHSEIPLVSSTEFVGIEPSRQLDARFLAYHLRSDSTRQELDSQVQSVTRSHQRVAPEDIMHLKVRFPSLEEQRRIADFLDAETARIDKLITMRDRQEGLLDERYRSLISELSTPGITTAKEFDEVWPWLPRGIPVVRLGYLARVQGGVTVHNSRPAGKGDVEYPYLRVANVQGERIDLSEVKTIVLPRWMAASSFLRSGDVVMTEANGNPDNLGRGAVWRGEIENMVHQNHVFAIRVNYSKLLPEYLTLLLASVHGRRYFRFTSTQVGIATTSSSKMLDLPVPACPIDEQRRIVREYENLRAWMDRVGGRLVRQRELLRERRQALITAAVTGEFDVSAASGRGIEE